MGDIAFIDGKMTSLEIAKLTGKRHTHILRDIDKMFDELENSLSPERGGAEEEYHRGDRTQYNYVKPSALDSIMGFATDGKSKKKMSMRKIYLSGYKDGSGKENRMYILDKRLSLILATGYSVVWRAKIIDRWEELESQNNVKTPQTYLEALEALVESQKAIEATGVKLVEAEKKIEKLTHTGKLYTATEIAKELGMRSAIELNKRLEAMGLQYMTNDTWVLRSWLSEKGYTSIKQTELESGKMVYNRMWTGIGRDWLLGLLEEKGMEVAVG